ncbi:lysoplasmalogenase [[Mycobacterium] kokjensenii]|uniref:Lysoplasmalogenase n=1 Tax=[Mycobacterium] kokjensenii TaxID=3064287 RepID=A0ABM9LHW9_9MYCO|nr:lysoplasmalogenase [Mycolicibacter sp. MU0083]CAJ1499313.1 lysoplasmalogenase [Mycolicibacter sp. MU0083]
MGTRYATRLAPTAWAAAGWAGVGYGVFLTVVALRSTPGEALTGQWVGQPAFKAAMAVLLAVAATAHPVVREARWLVPALVFSAIGDWLLAIPWWEPSFVAGLAAFLVAHLCFLGALLPLAVVTRGRLIAAGLVGVSCLVLLAWFWPGMAAEGMTVPVTVYVAVLGAMVCAALLAKLPTRWTAIGAVCFAVSDGMIGASQFVLGNELLAVPIWWAYGAAQLLITAGFFFGRTPDGDPAAD